jgi:hypothetical protein
MRFFKQDTTRMLAVAIIAAVMGLSAGIAIAGQPDMEGALEALKGAQAHLNHVTQDKGGHASAARKLVASAIEEVQQGIAFGHAKGE